VPATLLIIFLLLYLNFRSLTETMIVMLSLPFALVGGLWQGYGGCVISALLVVDVHLDGLSFGFFTAGNTAVGAVARCAPGRLQFPNLCGSHILLSAKDLPVPH